MKSPLKSFVKKSNFQSVIFAITSVTINGHTYILFTNIHNDVQAKGKGEIKKIVSEYDQEIPQSQTADNP